MNNLRLSSKQKELLAKYVVKNKINIEEIILDERNEALLCLARQINCTPKCIVNYVKKRVNKKSGERGRDQQIDSTPPEKDDLAELRKRDVFYMRNPPNAYPFGRKPPSKEKSSCGNNFNQISVLGDLTNSLVN